jgi:hypothetical protein
MFLKPIQKRAGLSYLNIIISVIKLALFLVLQNDHLEIFVDLAKVP